MEEYGNNIKHDPVTLTEALDFERTCARILELEGYTDVTLTKQSGDHGTDIVCRKDGELWSVQCKCHRGTVGCDVVRDTHGGAMTLAAEFGEPCHGMLIVSGKLSREARTQAETLGVVCRDFAWVNRNRVRELPEGSYPEAGYRYRVRGRYVMEPDEISGIWKTEEDAPDGLVQRILLELRGNDPLPRHLPVLMDDLTPVWDGAKACLAPELYKEYPYGTEFSLDITGRASCICGVLVLYAEQVRVERAQ
jgi:hypothetical protein